MRYVSQFISAVIYALCVGCGHVDGVSPPDVRINPAPRELQHFIISVTDRSDAIEGMWGVSYYNIANDSCVPLDYSKALGGIHPSFTQTHPFMIDSGDVGNYEAKLYRDMYESSDYYGLGVCRWELTGINIYIARRDGKKQHTSLHEMDLKYGAYSYATCPTGSPAQHTLNCAFSRSHPIDVSGDFYTISITSRRN